MKVLLAGGGSAGHINPAIAIANLIKNYDKDAEIAFIATKKGMENRLVGKAGYPVHHIEMQGLRRSLSLSNIKTAYYYFTSPIKAKKLIREFSPDLVIGTGGYLCWPLLHMAAKMGVPTAVHESNAIPGKAVKMLEKEVDRIYTNFPATEKALKHPEKALHVGNPLICTPGEHSISALREKLGIPKTAKKVILSFGGSLGAARVNEEVLKFMCDYTMMHPEVFHVHATGRVNYDEVISSAKTYGITEAPNIKIFEYIYDMPLWEEIADVVICRAGAMTISEMALLSKACILIPSPNVANNHQYENAKRLADADAAILLEEKDLSADTLVAAVTELLTSPRKKSELSANIAAFANPKAGEDSLADLLLLAQKGSLYEPK